MRHISGPHIVSFDAVGGMQGRGLANLVSLAWKLRDCQNCIKEQIEW